MLLASSVLAADFARLADHAREALDAGADWLHVDVMDGCFVPNISFGPVAVEALRPLADEYNVPIDVHLMIEEPERYLGPFAEAGADRMTVHVETCPHLHRTVEGIRDLGCAPGVTLNPATPLSRLEEILPFVDLVLVMTVNPGFGGQSYIPTMTDKIRRLREMLDARGLTPHVQIDGGIDPSTIAAPIAAGADVVVAGSAVFGEGSVAENVQALRRALELEA